MHIKFMPLGFNEQVSYSFVNDSKQIIDERVIGQVHLRGKVAFSILLFIFNGVEKVNSWIAYDNLSGSVLFYELYHFRAGYSKPD